VIDADRKAEVLAATDVFVLPSYAEALPMAMLEAMAQALPVICTRVGAIDEAVTDGVEGFLIGPGDVDALAQRMATLAGDPQLRRRMGRAARRRVERQFSLETMVDRLAVIYERAVGRPR